MVCWFSETVPCGSKGWNNGIARFLKGFNEKGISFQAFAPKFQCWHLPSQKSAVCVERCMFTVGIRI